MPKYNQLNHITLICKNLDKTQKFLEKIFNAVIHYTTKNKIYSLAHERFFKIGHIWLVIMAGKSTIKSYNHIAFHKDTSELPRLKKEIQKLGLTILPGRRRKKTEGQSLYFYDYDNHLFELHCGNLTTRICAYKIADRKNKRPVSVDGGW